jgi:hypothetical protein
MRRGDHAPAADHEPLQRDRATLDPDRGFPVEATARPRDLSFARLMRMLGVTENAIVEWFFNGSLELSGTLVPLALEGPVNLRTRDFRVYGEPYHHDNPRRIIAMDRGNFTAQWSIREDAVRFDNIVGAAFSRANGRRGNETRTD